MQQNIEVKKNHVIIISLILLLLCFLFNFLVYLDQSKVDKIENIKFVQNEEIEWNIDFISVSDTIRIGGWAVILDEEINSADYRVILRDVNTNHLIEMPTQVVERADVDEHFNNGMKYGSCGFYSNIRTSKVDLENTNYEVIINYRNNNKNYYVETGNILKN